MKLCQNCGAKNDDASAFCEECGHPFSNTNTKQKEKGTWKGRIIIFLEVLLLLGAFFLGGVALYGYGPEREAETYLTYYANRDSDRIFKEAGLKESNFLKKSVLTEYLSGSEDYTEVAEIKAERAKVEKTADRKTGLRHAQVDVKCFDQNGKYLFKKKIALVNDPEEKKLIFPVWKPDPAMLVTEHYQIQAHKNAKVTLDHIVLTEEYLAEEQADNPEDVLYEIPAVFTGEHHLNIKMAGMKALDEAIVISGSAEDYEADQMILTEEEVNKIQKLAVVDFRKIYTAAGKGAKFDTVKDLFTTDKDALKEIASQYQSLVDSMKTEQTVVEEDGEKQVNDPLYRFSIESIQVSSSPQSTALTLRSGDYTAQAVNLSFYGAFEYKDNYRSDSIKFTMYFISEKGQWVLESMEGWEPFDEEEEN